MVDAERVRLLMDQYLELERLEQEYGAAKLRDYRRRLEQVIAQEMDPDECGSTLWLRLLDSGNGFVRVSCFPDAQGHTRITHATHESPSIDYGWVANNQVRRRLTIDYYAMEFAAVVSVNDGADTRKRFLQYCLHAQFQLEPLMRYFYQANGMWSTLQYKDKWGNIRDPSYSHLQRTFGKTFYPYFLPTSGDPIPNYSNRNYFTLNALRLIRNFSLHRFQLPDSAASKKQAIQAMNVWINMRYKSAFMNEKVEAGIVLEAFDTLDFHRVTITVSDVVQKMKSALGL